MAVLWVIVAIVGVIYISKHSHAFEAPERLHSGKKNNAVDQRLHGIVQIMLCFAAVCRSVCFFIDPWGEEGNFTWEIMRVIIFRIPQTFWLGMSFFLPIIWSDLANSRNSNLSSRNKSHHKYFFIGSTLFGIIIILLDCINQGAILNLCLGGISMSWIVVGLFYSCKLKSKLDESIKFTVSQGSTTANGEATRLIRVRRRVYWQTRLIILTGICMFASCLAFFVLQSKGPLPKLFGAASVHVTELALHSELAVIFRVLRKSITLTGSRVASSRRLQSLVLLAIPAGDDKRRSFAGSEADLAKASRNKVSTESEVAMVRTGSKLPYSNYRVAPLILPDVGEAVVSKDLGAESASLEGTEAVGLESPTSLASLPSSPRAASRLDKCEFPEEIRTSTVTR